MALGSKSILLIGLIAWLSTSCTETGPEQDSSQDLIESEMSDSVVKNDGIELMDTTNESKAVDSTVMNNTYDRIEDTQDRLREQLSDGNDGQSQSTPKYKLNVEPFDYFADTEGYISFKGRTLDEIQNILGDAPIVVKQSIAGAPVRKEVRVYMPYKEDATGLYLFIQNEIVQDFRLDEFNGIQNSSIMEFFESR